MDYGRPAMIFIDSSALVKRYLKEKGSEKVQKTLSGEKLLAASKLAYPEVLSAFMRKQRAGELGEGPLKKVLDWFFLDWDRLIVVELNDGLLPIARTLIQQYPLKGADAVHLASALWLSRSLKENLIFMASDQTLLKAGLAEHLLVMDPAQS
jgi:predicted nucleic acid-binding protein